MRSSPSSVNINDNADSKAVEDSDSDSRIPYTLKTINEKITLNILKLNQFKN